MLNAILAAIVILTNPGLSPPEGNAPAPVSFPHFPDRLSAFVWRNWPLVPVQRLAEVVHADPADIIRLGNDMGLDRPPPIPESQWRRSYITIIRRNWHLLPYDQLLQLLDWTPEQLTFTLREDDFLFHKLGAHKPRCAPLIYSPPDDRTRQRLRQITGLVRELLPHQYIGRPARLFDFVADLSAPLTDADRKAAADRSA
jgi:hypothetical protein